MKKDMFDCANIQYKVILHNKDIREFRDVVLVNCYQMLEMTIKGLLKEKVGTYPDNHSLVAIFREFDSKMCAEQYNFIVKLTLFYHTNLYESDDYYEYSQEEYEEVLAQSMDLYKKLLEMRCKDEVKKLDLF